MVALKTLIPVNITGGKQAVLKQDQRLAKLIVERKWKIAMRI